MILDGSSPDAAAPEDAAGPPTARAGGSSFDASGEAALVERFWDRIRLFARKRLATASECEDVAQETLRRVIEALRQGRLHTQEALPAFVFQTARNICHQRHRSTARQGRAFAKLRPWMAHEEAAHDPLGAIQSERRVGDVRRALAQLDDGDRELIRMSYYQSLDTTEVARRLEVTPGAVRVRRYRALRRLRALLEDSADRDASGASTHRKHGHG